MEQRTRPCSVSITPYPDFEGDGVNKFEAAFACRLTGRLWAVLQEDEENAKAGKGREAIMRWKSELECCRNAWGSPTDWYMSLSTPVAASSPESPIATAAIRSTHSPYVLQPLPPKLSSESEALSIVISDNVTANTPSEWLELRGVDLQLPRQAPQILKRKKEDGDEESFTKRRQLTQTGAAKGASNTDNRLTPPSTPSTPSPSDLPTTRVTELGNQERVEDMTQCPRNDGLKRASQRRIRTQGHWGLRRSRRIQGLSL